MAPVVLRILLIDDDQDDYYLTSQMLSNSREGKFDLKWASSFQAGQAILSAEVFDAIIVDFDLGTRTGIELIKETIAWGYSSPMLLYTGRGNYGVEMEAMEAGATAYIPKDEVTPLLLERTICYAIDRKASEKILKSSEERFRQLANAMPQLVWSAGPEGKLDYYNDRHRALQGIYQDAGGNWHWQDSIHPDDLARSAKAWQQAIQSGQPYEIEQRVQEADGTYHWYLTRSIPATDSDGKVIRWYGTSTNIDRLKMVEIDLAKANAELVAANDFLGMALRGANLGVWSFDLITGIFDADERSREMHGYEVDRPLETIEEAFRHHLHPEDRERSTQAFRQAILQNGTQENEYRVTLPDGKVRWIASYGGVDPTHTRINGIVQDITERVRTQEALLESEYRLRIGLENSNITVFSQDHNLRYTWIFSSTAGNDVNDMLGKRDDEIQSIEDPAKLVALKQTVIDTGQGLRKEISLRIHGEDHFFLVAYEPLLDKHNQVIGLRGSSIDVTQQHQLMTQQLEYITQMTIHRHLLEHRERERQAIAHDLHDGPIQDISGLLFDIQTFKENTRDPALQHQFENISVTLKRTVENLRGLMNDLRPPSLIRFGITKAILQDVIEFREKYPQIKIELDLHPIDDESLWPEQITLTLFRIYQEVMKNVARHALATKAWIHMEQKTDCILFEISDDGKGFSIPDTLVELTQNDHFGLVGIKERIDNIGGEFQLRSKPGYGTKNQRNHSAEKAELTIGLPTYVLNLSGSLR